MLNSRLTTKFDKLRFLAKGVNRNSADISSIKLFFRFNAKLDRLRR